MSHIYYIPLGGGSLVATVQKCAGCGNQYHYTAERFASMLDPRGGACAMTELMQRTNPEMWEKIKQFYPENDPANLPPHYFGHMSASRFIAPVATGPIHSEYSPARMFQSYTKNDPFIVSGARSLALEADVQAAAKWLKVWAWAFTVGMVLRMATPHLGLGSRGEVPLDVVAVGGMAIIMSAIAYGCHRLADGLAARNPNSCKNAFYLYTFGVICTVLPLLIAVLSGNLKSSEMVSLPLSSSVAVLTFWALGKASCTVCTPAYEEALRQPGEVPPIASRPLFIANAACMAAFVFGIVWSLVSRW